MIIYKITNLINNKIYIGQTVKTINARWRSHCFVKTTFLGRAINKYGKNNFKKEIIETVNSMEELNNREIFWIKHYNSTDREIGYNCASGGNRFKHSEESIEKMRVARRNRISKPFSESHKMNMSLAHKRRSEEKKKNTPEIVKIRRPRKGYPLTEKHKEALRKGWEKRRRDNPTEFDLKYLKDGKKSCSVCKEIKELGCFSRKKRYSEARESQCSDCVRKRKGQEKRIYRAK
jgi:group I intron endonuclease